MTLLLTILAVLTSISFSTSTPILPNSAAGLHNIELCPLDGLPCTQSGVVINPDSHEVPSASKESSTSKVSSASSISSVSSVSSASSISTAPQGPKPPRPPPPTAVPIIYPTSSTSTTGIEFGTKGPITPSRTTTLVVTITQTVPAVTVTKIASETAPSPVYETVPTGAEIFPPLSSDLGSESSWLYSPLPPTYTSEPRDDETSTSRSSTPSSSSSSTTSNKSSTSSPSTSPSITTKTSSAPISTTTPTATTPTTLKSTMTNSLCTSTLTYTAPTRSSTSPDSTYTVYTSTTTVRSWVNCGGCTNLAVVTNSPASEQPLTFTKVVTAASATWTIAFHCTTGGAEKIVTPTYSTAASPFTTITMTGLFG